MGDMELWDEIVSSAQHEAAQGGALVRWNAFTQLSRARVGSFVQPTVSIDHSTFASEVLDM